MSAPSSVQPRGIAPVLGNALVMLALAACAWLLAGLHDDAWWQAMPSAARRYPAAGSVLGYVGGVGRVPPPPPGKEGEARPRGRAFNRPAR